MENEYSNDDDDDGHQDHNDHHHHHHHQQRQPQQRQPQLRERQHPRQHPQQFPLPLRASRSEDSLLHHHPHHHQFHHPHPHPHHHNLQLEREAGGEDATRSSPAPSLHWRLSATPLSSPSPPPLPPSNSPTFLPPELYEDNNPDPPHPKSPPVPPAFRNGCRDGWQWNVLDKSHEVRLCGRHFNTAFFHPNWSNGTAGVRGTRPLNGGVHYWEIRVSSRLFGTSMMFGVATRHARLHADSFLNLLGEDDQSWGLSHKGMAWHKGDNHAFCSPFAENVAVIIGMVFDGVKGTLEYYKNGASLGVAFSGLNAVTEDLFPAICSTAAKTEMTLGVTRRAFLSLQDRCRDSIVHKLLEVRRVGQAGRLPLPRVLRHYVWEEAQAAVATL